MKQTDKNGQIWRKETTGQKPISRTVSEVARNKKTEVTFVEEML